MPTVSDSDILQEEEIVDEPESDILDISEDNESNLVDTESDTVVDTSVDDVSGNDFNNPSSLPLYEESMVALPDAIALNETQFEALVQMHMETNQNIKESTITICILLGVLIGIVFVRGLGNFIRGV